jgi:hypothetical protein
MRHPGEGPEHAGGGGSVGLVVVSVVALALLGGSVAADERAALTPGSLLATWAVR